MDIKYSFHCNPIQPAILPEKMRPCISVEKHKWLAIPEKLETIGADESLFTYDNELPQHKVYLNGGTIGNRLITNGEFMEFIQDNGYGRVNLWLSEGWAHIKQHQITHPHYWYNEDGVWSEFTLWGNRELDLNAPVSHINFYEAEAYTRWCDSRLPTEFEWEVCSKIYGDINANQSLDPAAPKPNLGSINFGSGPHQAITLIGFMASKDSVGNTTASLCAINMS